MCPPTKTHPHARSQERDKERESTQECVGHSKDAKRVLLRVFVSVYTTEEKSQRSFNGDFLKDDFPPNPFTSQQRVFSEK